jgi:hypothetical protein
MWFGIAAEFDSKNDFRASNFPGIAESKPLIRPFDLSAAT